MSEHEHEKPKIPYPGYSLSAIDRCRDDMVDTVLPDFNCPDIALEGASLDDMAARICRFLPRVRYQTIYDSVRYLAGRRVTRKLLFELSWRLAGNLKRLQEGIAVPPWNNQPDREWVPVQILSHTSHKTQRGKYGGIFRMRALAGTLCPNIFQTFWVTAFCRMLGREAGYTGFRGDSPFSQPPELVNMRLYVLLEPEDCRRGEPGFFHVGCSDSLRKWNKGVIDMRFRRNWECPFGYTHACWRCPVGYRDCPASTHRDTHYAPEGNEDETVPQPVGGDQGEGPRPQ